MVTSAWEQEGAATTQNTDGKRIFQIVNVDQNGLWGTGQRVNAA